MSAAPVRPIKHAYLVEPPARVEPKPADLIREEKEIRKNLTEEELDKLVKDSMPASDPPGNY